MESKNLRDFLSNFFKIKLLEAQYIPKTAFSSPAKQSIRFIHFLFLVLEQRSRPKYSEKISYKLISIL